MQFADLNETARREWLHAEDLIFRFECSNRFCDFGTFLAKRVKNRSYVILDQHSLSTEKRTLKRGEFPTLVKLATTSLERLLLRSPSLEDLGYLPQLASETGFRSDLGGSVVLRPLIRSRPFPVLSGDQ